MISADRSARRVWIMDDRLRGFATARWIFSLVLPLALGVAPALAQTSGPLAPAQASAPPLKDASKGRSVRRSGQTADAAPSKARTAKPHGSHPANGTSKPRPPKPGMEEPSFDLGDLPAAGTAETRKAAASDNPLSLGMKWNGTNDTTTQTRVQNYGGEATGTGAEVGLKLHF